MSPVPPEPPAECPTCGTTAVAIVVTGPDAENIRYSCGCPIPAAVHRDAVQSGDEADEDRDEQGQRSGGERP